MKHIARVGKVWQKKGTDIPLDRELELSAGESISNYTMVKETAKKEAPFAATKKGMFDNGEN